MSIPVQAFADSWPTGIGNFPSEGYSTSEDDMVVVSKSGADQVGVTVSCDMSKCSWSSTGTIACNASQTTGNDFSTGGSKSGVDAVAPFRTTTYTVTCTNGATTIGSSDTVSFAANIWYLQAVPLDIPSVGGQSWISWSARDATSCTGSQTIGSDFSTGGATVGSDQVTLAADTTYTVDCTGPAGNDSAEVAVTVMPAPDTTAPDDPTNLAAVAGDTLFTATWDHPDPQDVSQFDFRHRCPSGSGEYTTATDASSPVSISSLTNDTVCDAEVSALDTSGNRSNWVVTTVTPMGGGAGGTYTVYNSPADNIWDCSHQLAADPSGNGVLFCDGWEDGIWFDASQPGACDILTDIDTNDGWYPSTQYYAFPVLGAANTYYCDKYGIRGNFRWAHYRPSATVVDTSVANFGIAGTRGVASTGWHGSRTTAQNDAMKGTHNVVFDDGGDGYDTDDEYTTASEGDGPSHFYVQYAFKDVGQASMMCDCNGPGGWDCDKNDSIPDAGACPAFQENVGSNTNGLKGIVQIDSITNNSGNDGWSDGRWFNNTPPGQSICQFCTVTNSDTNNPAIGTIEFVQNQSNNLRTDATRGRWYVIQHEVQLGSAANGFIRVWLDDCGADGLGCSGTPTLRAEYTNVDTDILPAKNSNDFRAVWINMWTWDVLGERQFDEFIVVDGSVRGANTPLPFVTNVSGVTSQ